MPRQPRKRYSRARLSRKTRPNPYKNARYKYRLVSKKKRFDKRSFRTVRFGARSLVRVGCPRGKWQPRKKRCRVGMRAYEILTRKTRRNPEVEYHERGNKYRGITYMSIGHDGDGILWIYQGGKILTKNSISDDDEEETHDTAFGPGHFWQGRYEESSGSLSILPPYRSEDRKVPVKILNLLISTFRPKRIYAFI